LGRKSQKRAVEQSLVWLIGSPRTGSTWLLNLLRVDTRVKVVDEPLIGAHLGLSAAATLGVSATKPAERDDWRALDFYADRDDYFFSKRYRSSWEAPLRDLVLARLGDQLADLGGRPGSDLLVVKEPHGSEAADLLASLTPGSRLLVLVRDGRDVVDSLLDAVRAGSWASGLATVEDLPAQRLLFLQDAARTWVQRMTTATAALDAHAPDRGLLVRYEELLDDTQGQLSRILAWLGAAASSAVAEHVERLSFAQVREEDKGSGRFHRAASPGMWRENLSPEEQSAVEAIMAPMLVRLSYEVTGASNGNLK
jgi:LPS sulfotransferase NodH